MLIKFLVGVVKNLLKRNPGFWIFFSKLRLFFLPRNPRAHLALGNAFLQGNQHEKAENAYRKASLLAPGLPEAFLGQCYSLEKQGAVEEAANCLVKYLDLDGKENPSETRRLDLLKDVSKKYLLAGCLEKAYFYHKQNRHLQFQMARDRGLDHKKVRYLAFPWASQIGHLAHLDGYAKIGLLGWRPPQQTVLLAHPGEIANAAYLNYWKPFFKMVTDPVEIEKLLPEALCLEDYLHIIDLPARGKSLWSPLALTQIQRQWEMENRSPLLQLSGGDLERGRKCLEKLGVPQGTWFVGLHVRESGFHKSKDYFQDFRDANVTSYLPAVRAIVEKGGYVIRMGRDEMKPLPAIEGFIDYSRSAYRSDWMDIFLCAQSRFFIGTQSGFSFVPGTFGVPCLWTNWATWGTPPWFGSDLFLPKLLWSESKKRLLTAREILATPLAMSQNSVTFRQAGIQFVENSPESIKDAALEMLEKLEKKAVYSSKEEERQREFQKFLEEHDGYCLSRLSRNFLRNECGLFS